LITSAHDTSRAAAYLFDALCVAVIVIDPAVFIVIWLVVAFTLVMDATFVSLLVNTISVAELSLLAETLNVVDVGSYVRVIVASVKFAPRVMVLLASETDNDQVMLPYAY
jgi:hypothetical protein